MTRQAQAEWVDYSLYKPGRSNAQQARLRITGSILPLGRVAKGASHIHHAMGLELSEHVRQAGRISFLNFGIVPSKGLSDFQQSSEHLRCHLCPSCKGHIPMRYIYARRPQPFLL